MRTTLGRACGWPWRSLTPARSLVVASVVLLQLACASAEKAVFHKAVATYTLKLDVSGVARVIVRSSLKEGELRILPSTPADARISGTMDYRIQGYYGSREDAGVGPVPAASMVFDQDRSDSTLTLRSREWLYIHHSMLYATLTLYVPDGVEVIVRPYSHDELTDRGTKD